MLKSKKRVPIVIVHDSSSSSDEEDQENQQPDSALPATSFDNNTKSICQQAFTTEINSSKNSSHSPDLDNLELYSSSGSDLADLPLYSYMRDSDNESRHSNTSTISTISSSTSSVYHSLTEDTPILSPHSPKVTTATTAMVTLKEEVQINAKGAFTRKSGEETRDEVVRKVTDDPTNAYELLIYSDDDDMDISPEISDYEENELQAGNDGLIIILNQLGITNKEDIKTISKYCILKSGRLYCHFNPSSSTNRGCQINFAQEDIVQFKTHLSIFHQIETCEISPVVTPSELIGINKSVNSIKDTSPEDDTISVNSLTYLYGMDDLDQSTAATTEDESIHTKASVEINISTEENQYDPEEVSEKGSEIGNEATGMDGNDDKQQDGAKNANMLASISTESQSTSCNTNSPQKAVTKAHRRRDKPYISKVTPKILRSTSRRAAPEEEVLEKETTSSSSSPARALRNTSLEMNILGKEVKPSAGTEYLLSGTLLTCPSPTSENKLLADVTTEQSTKPPREFRQRKDTLEKAQSLMKAMKLKQCSMADSNKKASDNNQNSATSSALPTQAKKEDALFSSKESRLIMKRSATTSAPARNKGGRPKKKQRTKQTEPTDPILQSAAHREATPTREPVVITSSQKKEDTTVIATPLDNSTSKSIVVPFSPPDLPESISAPIIDSTSSANTVLPVVSVTPMTPAPSPALPTTTPSLPGVSTIDDNTVISNNNADIIAPGTEAMNVIPAIPSDGLWPFQLGFGFFMRNKYHCNVTRSLGPHKSCKATFLNRSVFIQHLNFAHHLNEKNAMTYRESEDDDNLGKYIVDLIIAANLPTTAVNDKKFIETVKAIRGPTDIPVILPSLDRIRHSINEEYEACHLKIKQLLRTQQSISFSVHVWKPAKVLEISDSSILIVTAFFIDNGTWSLKDVIIGFKPIKEGGDEVIKSGFNEVLESFDIADKPYTITCPDLNYAAPMEEQLKNGLIPGIDASLQLLCLDQIIDTIKKRLFKHIKQNFTPLKKILKAISNFKDLPGPLAKSFTTILDKDDTSYYLLSEVTPIFNKYNDLCQSYPEFTKFELNTEDQLKIREMLYLISTVNQSTDWLMNSTNYRYPTANKVYIICMELLDSIYRVARCYGCGSKNDIIAKNGNDHRSSSDKDYGSDFSNNDSTAMEIVLDKMYMTVHAYMTAMKRVKENFIWTSLVLDTFSFTAYKGQEAQYFENGMDQCNSLAARPQTDELMSSVIKSQAVEIEKILNGGSLAATVATTYISPAGLPINQNDSTKVSKLTNKRQSVYPSIGLEEESSMSETEDHLDEIPIAEAIKLRKKQRLTESIPVEKSHQQPTSTAIIPTSSITSPYFQNFEMYISQFKADQKVLLVCNPSHATRSARADSSEASRANKSNNENDTKNIALSGILCNERNNFAQLTFWNNKKDEDEYYPRLKNLTKECFAVPTTSKESLRIAEEAKKHYTGLSCLHSDASSQENQMRTLLYIWRKDNYYTTIN